MTSAFWRSNFALIYSGKINIRVILQLMKVQNLHGLIFAAANYYLYLIPNK